MSSRRKLKEAGSEQTRTKYVAVGTIGSRTVRVSGDSVLNVTAQAKERGVAEPAVAFVPPKGITCLY